MSQQSEDMYFGVADGTLGEGSDVQVHNIDNFRQLVRLGKFMSLPVTKDRKFKGLALYFYNVTTGNRVFPKIFIQNVKATTGSLEFAESKAYAAYVELGSAQADHCVTLRKMMEHMAAMIEEKREVFNAAIASKKPIDLSQEVQLEGKEPLPTLRDLAGFQAARPFYNISDNGTITIGKFLGKDGAPKSTVQESLSDDTEIFMLNDTGDYNVYAKGSATIAGFFPKTDPKGGRWMAKTHVKLCISRIWNANAHRSMQLFLQEQPQLITDEMAAALSRTNVAKKTIELVKAVGGKTETYAEMIKRISQVRNAQPQDAQPATSTEEGGAFAND